MIRANPSKSDPFSQSVVLLRELHLLTIEGRDESEAADQVREAMEAPWRQLSSEERARLEGLSADLYSIGVDRVAPDHVSDELAKTLQSATEAQDWESALAFLRDNETKLPPADVAVLRGICWDRLGQPDASSLFFSESVRIKPNDFRLLIMDLRCLVRSHRLDEARSKARKIAASATNPYELLLAADVLFDCTTQGTGQPDADELRQVIEIANRASLAPNLRPQNLLFSGLVTSAYLAVALSRESIGDRLGAQAAYQKAIESYPANSGSNALHHATPFGVMQSGESFLAEVGHAKQVVDAELDASLLPV